MSGHATLVTQFDPASVGAAMAHANDTEQAALFNALAEELLLASGSAYAAQLQMTNVGAKVKPGLREVYANLYAG